MIPIIGAITSVLSNIFGLVDKVIPDKDQAARLKHDIEFRLIDLQNKLQGGQIEINKIEAAHKSLFVAGWRPAIGWICAIALGWHFIGFDILIWLKSIMGWTFAVPQLAGTDNLLEMVLAMLGLAGFRTYEKRKRIAREK